MMLNAGKLLVGCPMAPGATKGFGALAGWAVEGDDAARPAGIVARARAMAPTGRPRPKTGTTPGITASPGAPPPRQALSRMRDAGLVSRKAKA